MLKKLLRRVVPNHEKMKENIFMRRFAHWFTNPCLWHLNRHSVANAVAVGAFAGLIPGPFQVMTAALLSLLFRANLPLAAFVTFYSNPFTIAPLYWLAYQIGSWITGEHGVAALPTLPTFSELSFLEGAQALLHWTGSLGWPIAIGLPVLAVILAGIGYIVAHQFWRWHVYFEMCQRKKRCRETT